MARPCRHCGRKYAGYAAFCPFCGERLDSSPSQGRSPEQTTRQDAPRVDGTVNLYPDGWYRWVCEEGVLSEPTVLFLLWRIILSIGFLVWMLMLVVTIIQNDADIAVGVGICVESLPKAGLMLLVAMACAFGLYSLHYLLRGGRYCVLYEMNEHMLIQRQLPGKVNRDTVLESLSVMACMAARTLAQSSLNDAAMGKSLVSDFSAVRNITGCRSRNLIKINEPLAKNRVRVCPGDYETIMEYVRARCPNAKVARD